MALLLVEAERDDAADDGLCSPSFVTRDAVDAGNRIKELSDRF